MRGVTNCPNWAEIFGDETYDSSQVMIDKHYTATITPEEHNWEVILGQLEPTPTEEDFNSWTDREYAL